ncbi:hypothetical protein EVAR_72471_1 [Eumeta japonica]|uniref:Uncharacterized protein n=1 Tax=Eumeta variegata TaxID=151549 RepID=A0A4C1TIN4_EUMVA|nr:hypothetical protein EVAR_72471_1 [Eumeta japonica]
MAFSSSIKNPPLLKTRNITSQNSINWHQIPATPTSNSPQSQQQTSLANKTSTIAAASIVGSNPTVNTIMEQQEQPTEEELAAATTIITTAATTDGTGTQFPNSAIFSTQLSNSTETDV